MAIEVSKLGTTAREEDDVLSEVLSWVRMRGGRVFQTSLSSPFRLRFPEGPSHIHVVEQGAIWLTTGTGDALELRGGDVVLLTKGAGHEISTQFDPSISPRSAFGPDLFDPKSSRIGTTAAEPPPDAPLLVGGQFYFERLPLPPLLNELPEVIKVSFPDGQLPRWLSATTFFLQDETANRGPGSALMLSRIVELMVIRMLREWAAQNSNIAGWLASNRDQRLSRALTAIHSRPEEQWSLGRLAAEVGMSRSVFAERFQRAFGEPPLRYLTGWRLTLASELLQSTDLTVGQIADRVGYQSEPGFSRAFKARLGCAPTDFRLSSQQEIQIRTIGHVYR
jgi:AraC-like DNA-binding protein